MNTDKIFRVNKICPVCKNEVEVYRVKSNSYSLTGRDTDFCPHYVGINPLLYQVTVCPNCHYAAYSKSFGSDHPSGELERLKTLLPLLRQKDTDIHFEPNWNYAAHAFELLIRTMQVCKKPVVKLIPLFLKTGWCYRFIGDIQKERFFLNLACQELEKSYMNSILESEMSEIKQIYLIGELKRRLGHLDEAIIWFSKAVSHPQIKSEPEIERLTRDQWYIAKEEKSKLISNNKNLTEVQKKTAKIKLQIEIDEMIYEQLKAYLSTAPLPSHTAVSEFIAFLLNRLQNDKINRDEIYEEFKNTLSHI